jgi:hypothetical protein
MKFAVFQICEAGGAARLVYLEMPSLQSAANLEHRLTMNADPTTVITLLGRFDNVCIAMNEEEAESLSLTKYSGPQPFRRPVAQVRDEYRRDELS